MIPGFWRDLKTNNNRLTLGGFGVLNNVWYVAPQGFAPTLGNPTTRTFSSFAALSPHLRSRDIVYLVGVLREQFVAPDDIYDVTVVGAANLPRQATSGGTPTGGGACWLAPTSPTAATPLLELRAQGWSLQNIEFTPVDSSAAVRLTRSASVDTIDAGHANFSNCWFAANGGSSQIGIEDNGGCGFVEIDNCRFSGLTGTAILGLSTAAAVPQQWRITNNLFLRNTNAIAMSLTQGLVANNVINQAADDANNKVNLVALAGQGSLNFVINNIFSDAAANVTIAKGYAPGTTDVWRNYVTDTAAYIVTVPA